MPPKEHTQLVTLPTRRRPHHGTWLESTSANPIFLTVCTQNRAPALACDHVHEVLKTLWSDRSRWIVGRYMLMPEHVHLLVIEAAKNRTALPMWIKWWKGQSTKHMGNQALRWQKDFWDTRIRTEEMLMNKLQYIENNPVRRGLVEHSAHWRFQGTIWPFAWNKP